MARDDDVPNAWRRGREPRPLRLELLREVALAGVHRDAAASQRRKEQGRIPMGCKGNPKARHHGIDNANVNLP